MSFTLYTTQTGEAVCTALSTTLESGVTEESVALLKQRYGANELTGHVVTWVEVLGRQFKSPFIYVLAFAAGLSFVFGEEKIDGILICIFIAINTLLGFFQEYSSERSLELLKTFVVSRAHVLRDGLKKTIDSKELVPGDIVFLNTGDIVPADMRLLICEGLSVDESVLSGESVSVSKNTNQASVATDSIPLAENIAFSGSKVVEGSGCGVVVATGKDTVIGDVAALTTLTEREGLFEKGIAGLSAFTLKMIVAMIVLVFALNLIIKGGGEFADLVLFSVALAVSVIPEALPVVTTLSLSKGALRLAKNNVVVKRLAAVEDLGSIEILCTDKTGTITENRLHVADVYGGNRIDIILHATLASSFLGDGIPEPNTAFDVGLWNALPKEEHAKVSSARRIYERSFDPLFRSNSVLIEYDTKRTLLVRGAPESVLEKVSGLSDVARAEAGIFIESAGRKGQRVIALAQKVDFVGETYSISDESDLEFIGLVSFVDPIKTTATQAIRDARELGVTIKILTGDSVEVARAVAVAVGIITKDDSVMSGDELDVLPESEQELRVQTTHVFARVSPRQKHRIIELLKKRSRVGFMGEGINDAPALKAANVALVVKEASDIARDSADIVLLDPSLEILINGIQSGREILLNTVKYLKITLISNFGNFFAVAVASLLIPFLPMMPIQLLLLNLLTDFPMIAIALDWVDRDDVLHPQTYDLHDILLMSIVLGFVSTLFDFIFFGLFYRSGGPILQTYWFVGSVLTELALIYSVRTRLPFWKARRISPTLALLTIPAAVIALVLPLFETTRVLFGFVKPTMYLMSVVLCVAILYFATTEFFKLLYYRFSKRHVLLQ